MVLKVYDIKKSQQSDLYFAGSFCLVYQAKLTNSKRYILHICDFSRGRLNVRVKTLAFNLCSEVTNVLYLSFWVLFVGSSVREISWRDLGKRTGDVECRNYLKPPSNSSKNKF